MMEAGAVAGPRRSEVAMRSRIMLAALLVAGCASPSFTPVMRPLLTGPVAQQATLRTDSMQLLVDGTEIFPAAFELIDGAKTSIQMTFFLFGGDLGRKIGEKLLAKKAAGVDVQLIIDPSLGQTPTIINHIKPVIEELRAKGLEIRTYPTKLLPAPKPWLKSAAITHAKLIVRDGEEAMIGGMNFLDSEMINRDYMLRVKGSLAEHLKGVMNGDWALSGNKPPKAGTEQDWNLGETSPSQQTIRPLWVQAINNAQSSIDVEMLLMDDPTGVQALINAHKRGVKVRVLLDETNLGKHTYPFVEKLPLKGAPNWSAVSKLLDSGVQVGWYQPRQKYEMLHAKTAVIDGTTGLIGSANFTVRAWGQNREVSLKFADAASVTRLQNEIQSDWAQRAKPVPPLSKWQKFVAKVWERVLNGKTSYNDAEQEIENGPARDD
jgi:phosphatidylserine/phosphatidylglycerophosphate/cardiolipin synthase-like enzyme